MSEKGPFAFLRENIEAFAVAIAMALILRHFCVEAFRIPSNSMRPTLCGDHMGPDGFRRQGDRILVDKFVWLRRDPRRYEVAVFLYPPNVNRNFIKRIAGMPGEWLRIVDGDLWTSRDEGKRWSIARKPAELQDSLFFPYFPDPVDRPGAFASIQNGGWQPGPGWQPDGAIDRFRVEAPAEESELVFLPRVLPYDEVDTDRSERPPYVGDVRVSFLLDAGSEGEVVVRILEHGVAHRLVLGARSGLEAGGRGGRKLDIPFRLGADGSHGISFANVDNTLVAVVDGEETRLEFDPDDGALPEIPPDSLRPEGADWWRHSISIAAKGLRAKVSRLRIDRDLHYICTPSDRLWKIPADSYFMLGDNTQNSNDSRGWNVTEIELKDGRVFRFREGVDEGIQNPWGGRPIAADDAPVVIQEDSEGCVRRFRNGDVVRWETAKEWPFVPRRNLVGRAFSVFWPIHTPRAYSGPTRVKLIR